MLNLILLRTDIFMKAFISAGHTISIGKSYIWISSANKFITSKWSKNLQRMSTWNFLKAFKDSVWSLKVRILLETLDVTRRTHQSSLEPASLLATVTELSFPQCPSSWKYILYISISSSSITHHHFWHLSSHSTEATAAMSPVTS